MIPVFYDKPEDLRQPHCWIDPDKVVRITPVYGVLKAEIYFISTPDHPNAELFEYTLHYFDGTIFRSGKEVVEGAFDLKKKNKIGFQRAKSKDEPQPEDATE